MNIVYIGSLLVTAAAAGMLGQFVAGYSRGGCPVAFIVAAFGAAIGPAIARELGIAEPLVVPLGEVQFPLVTSAASAFLLVIIINLATKHRKF